MSCDVRGVTAAFLVLAPLAAVAVLAESAGSTAAAGAVWLAVSAQIAAPAGQWWLDRHQLDRHWVARERSAEMMVTLLAVAGVLLAVAPAVAAVVAMLVAAGVRADSRAAASRAAGVAAGEAPLARVADQTAALVNTVRGARPQDRAWQARLRQLAAVDRFAEAFRLATSRVVVWSRLAEVLLAPVSLVAVVLMTGAVLGLPRRDVLVCSLFAPYAGVAVTRFRQQARPAPTAGAGVRALVTGLWRIRRDEVARLAVPAVRTAVLAAIMHGSALALFIVWLMAPRAAPSWALAAAALAVAHAALLARSATLAQLGGTATLRMLSYAVTARIARARPAELTGESASAFVTMATQDVVGASGLVVHGLRPGAGAVLVPCTAILAGTVLAGPVLARTALAAGDHQLAFLVLGSWLAGYLRSAGSVAGDLRRGLHALQRLRGC